MKHFVSQVAEADRLAAEGHGEAALAAYDAALALAPDTATGWIAAKRDRLAQRGSQTTDVRTLHLFMPFYTPKDAARRDELLYCLERNLETGLFARITLLVDDDTDVPQADRRLSVLRLEGRPTYLDWVRESRRRCPGQISVLANSDIHFDETIALLPGIFTAEPRAFVALTRFDKAGDALVPHSNPHWSQDTWAFLPGAADDETHDARFDIPLGVPRCDNKIAYVFATQGYRVFNPFPFVRSIHVHETNLRYYSKTGDRRVLGGVAMVHPGATLDAPAALDFEIWSERSDQVVDVRLNRSLERWAAAARRASEPRPAILAHDADWQYPAITEQHAFHRMTALLPAEPGSHDTVYLGFPFASLVDFHAQLGPDHVRTRALQGALDALAPELARYGRVVSVAQHIRVRQFAGLIARAGVTDLFWSHCRTGEEHLPDAPGMRVHPFPLYPVQQVPRGEEDFDRPRRWLYSFVGARPAKNYLTDVRSLIIDILGPDPRGKVVDRDAWHYQTIVYEAQIFGRAAAAAPGTAPEDSHAADFREIMDQSLFSLCPSGSGPNSIRLWEAILNGSIPVILADGWAAPGPADLWEAATVRSAETPAAVAALPHRLAAIAARPGQVQAMRRALLELSRRYGPEGFVTDVAGLIAPGPTGPR